MRGHALFAFALLAVFGAASAGTVTLTGSCPAVVLGGTAFFNLSNSGNDTAYSVAISPRIPGAQTADAVYSLAELTPGSTDQVSMTLANVTGVGTYAGYLDVAYRQGSDQFTAVFPCTFSFRNASYSNVHLTTAVVEEGAASLVKVSALNGGASAVQANVSLLLPPAFASASNESRSVALPPGIPVNVSFDIGMPESPQASYGAAAAASYEINGLGYASIAQFSIPVGNAQPVNFGLLALMAAFAAIAVLIVRLIYISFAKRKRRA